MSRTDPSGLNYHEYTFDFPAECITDHPDIVPYPYSTFESWFSNINDDHKYLNGWSIGSVGYEDEIFEVTFYYRTPYGIDYVPDEPDFAIESVQLTNEMGVPIAGETVQVVTLSKVGLLDQRTLDRIIRPTVEGVNTWEPLHWRKDFWEIFAKLGSLDSGFGDSQSNKCSVNTWMWSGQEYDNSDINYIMQGHAMRHLEIPKTISKFFVEIYKASVRTRPTLDTYFWWNKGWDEHHRRDSW